jgi:hemerythrin-like domain-containing protein
LLILHFAIELLGDNMDVVEQIIAGHRVVDEKRDMLSKFAKMLDTDPFFWDKAEKIEFFFKKELIEHFALEEKVLFPVLKKVLKGRELEILKAIEQEHAPLAQKLNELRSFSTNHMRYASKATREPMIKSACELLEKIAAHAQKEDTELFRGLKDKLTPENNQELDELYFEYLKI